MPARILCVDDEPRVLGGLRRMLVEEFELDLIDDPEKALAMLERSGPYGVVLADMRMPRMNGNELLAEVKRRWPETVRVMLTGDAGQDTAAEAVNRGEIFRFLRKPCSKENLVAALTDALKQHRLVRAEKELLEETLGGAIRVLTEILSLTDPAAIGRSMQLKASVSRLAAELGVADAWEIEVALMLSQLGRVTVPSELREKEAAGELLTPAEQEVVARVPEIGFDLVRHIPRLEGVAEIVRYQSARFDGSAGCPPGVDPPAGARILRALSDLAALEESGKSRADALREMQSRSGIYDPRVLACLETCDSAESTLRRAAPLEITFDLLRPGHVLASTLEAEDGRRLLGAGHLITRVLLEKLHNYRKTTGIREPFLIQDPGRGQRSAA